MRSSADVPEARAPGGTYRLYILQCADGSFYTGIALDVEARLREHDGRRTGAKYLRGRRPFVKVYECEAGDRSSAQALEYRVRRLPRVHKLRLIRGTLNAYDLLADQASGSGSG